MAAIAFTTEHVAGLAPDAASAAAGRKLAAVAHWDALGRSDAAVWGLCKGSAVYQVKADLADFGYHCSCPSRKFPCKHTLALLTLLATSAEAFATGEPPDWVVEWLSRRQARAVRQTEKTEEAASKPVDEQAQRKRVEKRENRVREGVERLDLWMRDLVRSGIAGIESKPASFWDEQAKRLVDAQAPGLATCIGRLAELPGSSPDWPEQLLSELGRLSLALHAYNRLNTLEEDLAADVRQLIGWNVATEDVDRDGERVTDDWLLLGQYVADDGRVRTQRTWAFGAATGRSALLLQFAAGLQPFAEPLLPGARQRGTLAFYPGRARLRAKFVGREGPPEPILERPSGNTIDAFLGDVAETLSRQPWLATFGGVLREATVVPGEPWHVRDAAGDALPLAASGLPLAASGHWKLLALTGGHPCDLAGEWDGRRFRPLGVFIEGRYVVA
ncbi:MAG: SWIM zinc finger family protein [Planctomycetaceae bacterium]